MHDEWRGAIRTAVNMDRLLRQGRTVERFGCCLGCFVPQELCNAWEEDMAEGGWHKVPGRKCQYEGVMVSTIAFMQTRVPDKAEELYGSLGFRRATRGDDERAKLKDVLRWMGKRVLWAKADAINMCRVFLYMTSPAE